MTDPTLGRRDTPPQNTKLAEPEDYMLLPAMRRFECFFNWLGWWQWSLGVHLDVRHPHLDLHVPFGFVRIGWVCSPMLTPARSFGYHGWRRESLRQIAALDRP